MINRVLCRMPQSESDLLPGMTVWVDCKPTDWFYLAVQEATNSHEFERKGEVKRVLRLYVFRLGFDLRVSCTCWLRFYMLYGYL